MKWQLNLTDECNIWRPSKTSFETLCEPFRPSRSNALGRREISGMRLCFKKSVLTIFTFPDHANKNKIRQDAKSHGLGQIMGRLSRLSLWIPYRERALIAVCLDLVAVDGYIDYATGYGYLD